MKKSTLTMLYDGACPFCRLEARWLNYWNREGKLIFEDISDPAFNAERYGVTPERMQAHIHAVLDDGAVISSMEVFRRAYGIVGLGWLLAPPGWPLLRPVCDAAYRAFARNRVRWGRLFGRDCAAGSCAAAPRADDSDRGSG